MKRTVLDVESPADNGAPYKRRRSLRVKGIVGKLCFLILFLVSIFVHLVLVFFICYCFEHMPLPYTAWFDFTMTDFCKTVSVNQFHVNLPFLYVLKTSENQRYRNALQGYRNGALVWNGLIVWTCWVCLYSAFLRDETWILTHSQAMHHFLLIIALIIKFRTSEN